MKWLVVYEGVITDSMGGRDDGYPETKTRVFKDDEALADYLGGGDFYKLTPATKEAVKIIKRIWDKRDAEAEAKMTKIAKALKKLTPEERRLLDLDENE
jgi:hypothetical protein